MKLHYLIILALVLFNAMLLITSGFFPNTTYHEDAVNVSTSDTYSPYGDLTNASVIWNAIQSNVAGWSLLAALGVVGLGSALVAHSIVPFAALLGMGFVTAMILGVRNVVFAISPHPLIDAIIGIITICIGIIIAADTIEAMKGRADV